MTPSSIRNKIACLLTLSIAMGGPASAEQHNPKVRLETSKGVIVVELFSEKAPISTENFLHYVDSGGYDGLIFHRVISGFMVQGGGFEPGMKQRTPSAAPIQNEADNGLKNKRGTLAMARTPDPHSASNQFFINLVDNGFLDHSGKTPQGWGYAVFGQVLEGMEAVDAIATVATGNVGGHGDVPAEDIVIIKAEKVQ